MSKFKTPTGKPFVTAIESLTPSILINKTALAKMQIYVEQCAKEVGWLGTAHRRNKHITINDVFLFDQEVHATTTEITPEGLAAFAEELLLENPETGMDIWNNIRVWGHSHVNMATSPSTQDNDQMVTFAEGGHDWFIRIIANKTGDLTIDLYDYSLGIVYKNLGWDVLITAEEYNILEQIRKLREQLDAINKDFGKDLEEPIKLEIKEKVRDKVYVTHGYQYTNPDPTAKINYGGTASLVPINQRQTALGARIDEEEDYTYPVSADYKKKTNTDNQRNTVGDNDDGSGLTNPNITEDDDKDPDSISSKEDVYRYFDDEVIMEIGLCRTYTDAKVIIEAFDDFDMDEILMIWNTAKDHYNLCLK